MLPLLMSCYFDRKGDSDVVAAHVIVLHYRKPHTLGHSFDSSDYCSYSNSSAGQEQHSAVDLVAYPFGHYSYSKYLHDTVDCNCLRTDR